MDNHPIPQDVTGFQFRLIGDMTLKQFAYLATGIALAWIMFALPLFFLLKFPLILLFAGGGAFLAFVPVEGRPSDMMLFFFIKALFSPNQYVFRQQADKPQQQTLPEEKEQKTFVEHHEVKANEEKSSGTDKKIFFQSLPSITQVVTTQIQEAQKEQQMEKQTAPQPPSPTTQPMQKPVLQEAQITQKTADVAQELSVAQAKEQEEKAHKDSEAAKEAHDKVLELQQQMIDLQKQKEELEKRLFSMQTTQTPKAPVFTPTTASPVQQTTHVRKIPTTMATSVGAPIVGDVPNLLIGIIKDARGNVLPNILIEVKDKDNNPVRAFKTNNLGQFASATPLLNGTYTLSFEDPAGTHGFDSVEISATGDIMLPIEVISVDQREKLRQELFGATMPVAST